jgi:HlyD family secretion protein
MKGKTPIVMTLVAAALAVGAGWWLLRPPPQDPDLLRLSGNVDIRQVSLAFNANERIREMLVTEGDHVQAGQLLARLDDRTARLRLASADAKIAVQEQVLLRLRNGSRPEEVAQARANVAAAEAEAELAARQLARLQSASDATAGRGVSQQDVDSARSRLKVSQAQADGARNAAQLVTSGPRREDIAQADRQLGYVRAERALIQRQIDESELHAPMAAVVRSRLLEPGDMASPQRPVLTLAITQPKWVRAYVPETRLAHIRIGMAAEVSVDGLPGRRIPARLTYIASVAEFTPKTVQTEELRTSLVYEVRFTVDDPQDELRLGMPATVALQLPVAEAAQVARRAGAPAAPAASRP